jgi:type VI secretion system secreted protein Hcp
MADSVHLFLVVNGVEVQGESTQTSLGREDSIECVYYEQKGLSPRDPASGMAIGRRYYEPLVFRKRIDKSSPVIHKAFCENQAVEATFKFYRPNPAGDGTTEQFYSVTVRNARINSVREWLPDTLDPAASMLPPLQEVAIVFSEIRWTFPPTGASHEDEIASRR